jgi:hypothetical protein
MSISFNSFLVLARLEEELHSPEDDRALTFDPYTESVIKPITPAKSQ